MPAALACGSTTHAWLKTIPPCSTGSTLMRSEVARLPPASTTRGIRMNGSVRMKHVPDGAPVVPGIANGSGTPPKSLLLRPITPTPSAPGGALVAPTRNVIEPLGQSGIDAPVPFIGADCPVAVQPWPNGRAGGNGLSGTPVIGSTASKNT